MPSFDELLLSQLQQDRESNVDPTDGTFSGTSPRTMMSDPPNGFMANVYDSLTVQPFYQLLGRVTDSLYPVEEGYDPLTKEELKGYEQYAAYFRESRSRAETEALKRRIDSIDETKQRLAQDGGIVSELVAEIGNPLNYVGVGAIQKGIGFARGALRGATAIAPGVLLEETLRSQVDPTATREELAANTFVGLAFGGLLGGTVGSMGGTSTMRRMIDNYNTTMTRLDGDVPTSKLGEGLEASGIKTGYEAKATDAPTGVASAFGVEKLTSRLTSFNRMVAQGYTAVEDFANAMAGEFDVMFNRNKLGIPTEGSAYLRAGQWRGMAADTISNLDRLYNEYLGNGADPLTIGNVNLPVTLRRIGQTLGMRPSDGLMTYQEFMEAVFRAHKRDRIETDSPFVERAAKTVREFFDKARDEGVSTGFLFSTGFQSKAMARYTDRVAQFDRQIAVLDEKISNGEKLTSNEMVEFRLLNEAKANAERKLARAKLTVEKGDLTEYEGPAGEKFYLPRQWDIEAILADEAGPQQLRQILTNWFKANPPSTVELERISGLIDDILEFKTRQNPKKVELLAYLEKLGDEWKGLSPNQYDLLVQLRNELGTTPTFSKSQWDLLDQLTSAYRKEKGRLDYLNDADNVAKRVDQTIRNIIKQGEMGEYQIGRPGGGSFRLSRTLDIPNELVADFVQRDVGALIRSYASQAGIGIEFARKFGSRDAQDAIEDMLLQVAREAKGSVEQINKSLEDIRNNAIELRDLTTGDAYARNPASLSRDAAQVLTSLAAVTQMGGAVITSLAEPAKQIMIHGVKRTLGFALDAMADPDLFRQIGKQTQILTGEGMEVTLGMHMQRHLEMGGLSAPGMNGFGRAFHNASRPFVGFAQGPYYTANLLGPYTDIIKTYAGVMSSHFMIEDIMKVAKGQANDKLIEKLASYGLSVEDAKKIAAQPIEKGKRLNFANTNAWDDTELVAKFGMAVAGEIRRTVVTAGPANKPNIAQGFVGKGENMREQALLRLPFQYMNYGLAALNKNLVSALQGREANAFAGAAAMIGMGYMVARLKSSDTAWEAMPQEEKILRAVNFSGIAGIATDIPNMIENATRGEYGIRPALGLPPAYGYSMYDDYSPYATAAGPGGGKIFDLYKLFVDGNTNEREQAKIIRRMIPLNDLFYWKSLFNAGERQLTDQLY